MWQLTWMLSLLPDWFWSLVLIAGVIGLIASWILKKIPFISNNALPIKVISIILLLVGVYFQGVIANEEKWQARVKELEEKVRVAEDKSKETNVKIEEKIVYKDRIVKEKAQTQIQYIDRLVKGDTIEITKDMSQAERDKFAARQKELEHALKSCPVPQIIVDEHNKAAIKELNQIVKDNKK